jgi:hypothetical protein
VGIRGSWPAAIERQLKDGDNTLIWHFSDGNGNFFGPSNRKLFDSCFSILHNSTMVGQVGAIAH